MLFRYLLNVYIYVVGYICPSMLTIKIKNENIAAFEFDREEYNLIDEESYGSYDYYKSEIDNVNKESCDYNYYFNENRQESQRCDQYKEFISINDNANDYHTFIPIAKSQSMKIYRHVCGYCNNRIAVPTYMYCDNTFCNVTCRDRQIKLDMNRKTRLIHSRSV